MFNRERTLETYGYDLDPSIRRRTNAEFEQCGNKNKKQLLVIDNCPQCNKERSISLRSSRKNKPCKTCISKLDHVLEARRNQKHEVTDETKQKMRESHWSKRGGLPANKGIEYDDAFKDKVSKGIKEWNSKRTKEYRKLAGKKASCTKRGISLDEYEPLTPESARLRCSDEYKALERAVIDRDHNCQYPTCSYNKKSGLTVHHKDGFHWCLEKRYDPSNGVLLCNRHHHEFHGLHGKHNNTAQQFDSWIEQAKASYGQKLKLIVLGGASGSGKSWVAEQLTDIVSYVPFDKTPKEQHLLAIMQKAAQWPDKPVLYDPVRKSSTIFRRYSQVWDVKYIVIVETAQVVANRIASRGGIPDSKAVAHSVVRSYAMAKMAHFSGTSQEVLDHLKSLEW